MTKLDEDPNEQEEHKQEEQPGRRSTRRKKEQRDAARATTIAFSSEEWDKMTEAGWSVKSSTSLLGGAGYVLAPWRQNHNIRRLKGLTEGKDTGFWV